MIVYAPRGFPFGEELGHRALAGDCGAAEVLRRDSHPRLRLVLLAVHHPAELRDVEGVPAELPDWVTVLGVVTPAEALAYGRAADVLVAEGTSTIHEGAALRTPLVLVPGPIEEIRRLAQAMAEHEAARVLASDEVTAETLADAFETILGQPARRAAMVERAQGLICELGLFEGQTISYIARKVPDRAVFGFDSFEGLPEDWRGPFARGVFSTDGNLPSVPPNVTLIKGWFDATLPAFAAAHAGSAALLHVDCDLYSSTRCIFANLGSRVVPGSIIVFDEYFDYPGWEEHEFRAFAEFVAEAGRSYEYLAYNRPHEQVAVRITARRGSPTAT